MENVLIQEVTVPYTENKFPAFYVTAKPGYFFHVRQATGL